MGGAEYLWLESLFTLFIKSPIQQQGTRGCFDPSLMLAPNNREKTEKRRGEKEIQEKGRREERSEKRSGKRGREGF